jgi:hypothetical protein
MTTGGTAGLRDLKIAAVSNISIQKTLRAKANDVLALCSLFNREA